MAVPRVNGGGVELGDLGRLAVLRTVWTLAWPAMLSFGLESLVGLADVKMVGSLGGRAVASVGVGTQLLHAVSSVEIAVSTGTVALVARAIGAGQGAQASDAVRQSLYTVIGLAAAMAVAVYAGAEALIGMLTEDAQVVGDGTAYLRILMLGVPLQAVYFVAGGGLRGAGDMRTPLFIGAAIAVLNVVGDYALIFGHFGAPALGVRGAAVASVSAYAVGAVLALAWLGSRHAVVGLRDGDWRVRPQMVGRLLRIGGPAAVEHLLMQCGFVLYYGIVGLYGTHAMAAYTIGVRILSLCFLPGFGFGAAAGTLVGQRLGAQAPEAARHAGWGAVRLAMTFMGSGGVLIFVGAGGIAGMFIDEAAVLAPAVVFISTLAVVQPLMALDFTLGGALRGAGDTTFPLLTVLVGFYGMRLGFAWVAANVLHLELHWIWYVLIGDYLVRSCLKAWRFHSGRWQHARV